MFRPLNFLGLEGIEQIITDQIETVILGWAALAALYLIIPWFWNIVKK